MAKQSPKITHLSWGRLEIEGFETPFKDAKLFPDGAREWDWSETGTRHQPGIQPADVQELIDHGTDVVILSKGIDEQLHTMAETLTLLASNNVEAHVLQTEEAVTLYNELTENRAVGALVHSTC
ncbi:MAG: hypothetical protein DWQ07_02440 [Chloroflexi bacterium]|nr:MAG: hypothetical protein DWQ07_02440 [Chloroflexota bacterium]MBL1193642.1 hypothetical protein [Chloroflexota bacterium]NOH10934.1 hypothetical protein [Chloroflexota bacterium]